MKDASSNPVSGVTVTFTGPGNGASIVTTTAVTNASGVASAAVTANATAGGPYTVTAATGSATTATFSLTNTPGQPASVTAVSGGGQSATISTAFANPLVVTVKDAGSNLLSGVTVTFAGSRQRGRHRNNDGADNASGVASATVTANGTVGGPYTVTASTGSATSATFSLVQHGRDSGA